MGKREGQEKGRWSKAIKCRATSGRRGKSRGEKDGAGKRKRDSECGNAKPPMIKEGYFI